MFILSTRDALTSNNIELDTIENVERETIEAVVVIRIVRHSTENSRDTLLPMSYSTCAMPCTYINVNLIILFHPYPDLMPLIWWRYVSNAVSDQLHRNLFDVHIWLKTWWRQCSGVRKRWNLSECVSSKDVCTGGQVCVQCTVQPLSLIVTLTWSTWHHHHHHSDHHHHCMSDHSDYWLLNNATISWRKRRE